MVRARAVLELADVLERELEERGGAALLRDVELPLVDVLADMERVGIAVDAEHARRRSRRDFAAAVQQRGRGRATRRSAARSTSARPKQLQVVLFDELGMPKTKRTKTGYTTDAEALADLYAKTEHPFLVHLLRHRDASRLRPDRRGAAARRSPTTGASTRPTSRPSPRPAGCRAPTRTCRTSRSAPTRAAGSARRSSSGAGLRVAC